MRIGIADRTVSLSAREFAEFRIGPGPVAGGARGRWRAELGQRWHRELRRRAREANDQSQFEVSLQGALERHGWRVNIQGRIDQILISGETVRLREVKSVTAELPAAEHELRARYACYLLQIAIYLTLARQQLAYTDRILMAELLFVHVADGITQLVPVTSRDEAKLESQLDRLISFVEFRREAGASHSRVPTPPPYASLRPGQETAWQQVREAMESSRVLLFEAPTGFGKTGILLSAVLEAMQRARYDRVIYLTGKSTGQLSVLRHLEEMINPRASGLRFYQVRNRSEHAIISSRHTCRSGASCRPSADEHWQEAGIDPTALFDGANPNLQMVRELGGRTGVCPFEISRALLPFADIWICDYNYVFSPLHRSFLFDLPAFNAAETLIIVDEAHNLPGRTNAAFSFELKADDIFELAADLVYAQVPRPLIAATEDLGRYLKSLPRTDCLEGSCVYELAESFSRVTELTATTRIEDELLSPESSESLRSCSRFPELLENSNIRTLIWCPRNGQLCFSSLDASAEIASTLHQFAGSIMMSATLSPTPIFASAFGLAHTHTHVIRAQAPWRESAYSVAIDCRVDTRLRYRAQFFECTAATIQEVFAKDRECVAVFFPSYRYANDVFEAVQERYPSIPVAIQRPGADLSDQSSFLDASLDRPTVLFLILGSSYSESIDTLGGRVNTAIVVGPALPEVNAIQKARMEELSEQSRTEAFQKVYLIPAMTKINQALGRLVRAPGHHARVLLHGKRFAQPSYRELLDPELRKARKLQSRCQLHQWLRGE